MAEGSLIVIDEAWKLWPAAGRAKVSEDIEYLRMHRHYDLDFLLVAQPPNLIHAEVLCLVEKHLHITPTWSGRKIYEWPEYCSTFENIKRANFPSKFTSSSLNQYRLLTGTGSMTISTNL
ncbi:zonular occludens toxin domain-containing protein [Nitrosomonas sp. Nm33]|uniref:zonular occludens toxin domain-containing protein n=1 Tax=Nitrosomonas sp. Nm33 TaxID=133724 RepID=UPI0035253525